MGHVLDATPSYNHSFVDPTPQTKVTKHKHEAPLPIARPKPIELVSGPRVRPRWGSTNSDRAAHHLNIFLLKQTHSYKHTKTEKTSQNRIHIPNWPHLLDLAAIHRPYNLRRFFRLISTVTSINLRSRIVRLSELLVVLSRDRYVSRRSLFFSVLRALELGFYSLFFLFCLCLVASKMSDSLLVNS